MSQPRPKGAISDATKGQDRMKAKQGRHDSRAVIESGLHRMHRGSTEGRRVITLVMQTVHMFVEELANIRDAFHLKDDAAALYSSRL